MKERTRNTVIWTVLIGVSAVSAYFVTADKMAFMERNYDTFGEARMAGELERGSLPAFLPEDATDIRVINNTDEKSSLATFAFTAAPDLSSCAEAPLGEAALPAERVVLWWPEELVGKGAPIDGAAYYRCADGQAVADATKKRAWFWK